MTTRIMPAALVIAGLLIGYLVRPPVATAQPTRFPYGVGDAVQITYVDGLTRDCVIEQFYGSFVSCNLDRPFRPLTSPPRSFVYNLESTMMITLVARAGSR